MFKLRLLLIILIQSFAPNYGLSFFRPKVIKVDLLSGRCEEHPNAVITFDNVRLVRIKRLYTLSTKITVREAVENDMKLELLGIRCRDKDSPDTCENYQAIHVNRMCELVNMKNNPWSPFVEQIKPHLQCPIQKGNYHVLNATLDGNAFSALPLGDWYWKIKSKTREVGTNRMILCTYLEGQIVPV